MKVDDWLRTSTQKLEQAGIVTARLDALVLLEDVTGKDRSWLLAHSEAEISAKQLNRLINLFNRRLVHEPLAYIRRQTEFYGRSFVITPAVLEPRPESETMIELLKKLPGLTSPVRIADVGTGSGALGITAALELHGSQVELLEIDPKALKVAKTNVDKFTLNIPVVLSNLLLHTSQQNDLLLCNLPYVPDDFQINTAATYEPRLAIFGGPDGLDVYRRLFVQIKELSSQPLYILTESLPSQHNRLKKTADKAGYRLLETKDFIQLFRRR